MTTSTDNQNGEIMIGKTTVGGVIATGKRRRTARRDGVGVKILAGQLLWQGKQRQHQPDLGGTLATGRRLSCTSRDGVGVRILAAPLLQYSKQRLHRPELSAHAEMLKQVTAVAEPQQRTQQRRRQHLHLLRFLQRQTPANMLTRKHLPATLHLPQSHSFETLQLSRQP